MAEIGLIVAIRHEDRPQRAIRDRLHLRSGEVDKVIHYASTGSRVGAPGLQSAGSVHCCRAVW